MEVSVLSYTNAPYIWMDPRSKVLFMAAANVAMLGGVPKLVEGLFYIFLLVLLINGKQFAMSIKLTIIYVTLMTLDIYVTPYFSGAFGVMFLTLTRVLRMYLPMIASVAFLIKTTTVSEFVAAFDKMHVSEKLIIPFSVMFRFFPTIAEEWRSIQNAMRFRGIKITPKTVVLQPIKTMEYILVPLLMSAVKISGELSAASLSRGLGGDKKRTCIKQIQLGIMDVVVMVISIGFIVYTIAT